MYCSPYDPDYDGKGYTADEEANAVIRISSSVLIIGNQTGILASRAG